MYYPRTKVVSPHPEVSSSSGSSSGQVMEWWGRILQEIILIIFFQNSKLFPFAFIPIAYYAK